MITQIPKMLSLYLFWICAGGYSMWECRIVCGASYHVWDLPSGIICDDVAKDPSDCLSPLTSSVKSYFSESRYLARYFPTNIPWPMTPPPTLTASHGSPHSRRFNVAGPSHQRRDAASGPPPLRSCPNSLDVTRGSALRSSASWVRDNVRSPPLPPPPPLGTMPTFGCASSLSLSSL